MNIYELCSYNSPKIEIIEILVEQCFVSSIEDPIESPEMDW